MAIRKSKVTYVTDTGKEMEVDAMTASHLMNAIAHHQKQMKAVREAFPESEMVSVLPDNIRARLDNLEETVILLAEELERRHPNDDDQFRDTVSSRLRGSDY